MEMDNYLSSPEEGGAMNSLVIQPPQHKMNKYKDISYSKSHKSSRHWTEKDDSDRRRRSRHKRERKLIKNVELSGNPAGRYYKDQACMDDIRDRCISNKNSENRTHRGEDDIFKDLTKLCSSKRLFEDSGDVDIYKASRRAKESKKYKENEKWDSILQGEKTIFVGDISNIDSDKDGTSKSRLSNSSPTLNISDNETEEPVFQVKNLRTDKSTIKKQKVDGSRSKRRWQMNRDLELMSDHELQTHQHSSVTDSDTYNESEIMKIGSLEALQHVINEDCEENTVSETHVLEEDVLHHSISYQLPEPQLLENIDNLDTPYLSNTEPKDDQIEVKNNILPYYPAIQGCRSVNEFQILNRVNEGTYGVVYRARDKHSGDTVALKRLKMENEHEGFPITSLREINTLLKGQHPNIVTVREIVMGSNLDKIFIVMDFVEHDLKSLIDIMRHNKQSFTAAEVKCLLKQLLCAVAYLHDNWILHRDLKTSNLLLSQNGILKVGDFGLAREYGSPLKAYTPIVVTLWYRAPELLLGTKTYSTHIDVWSVGCIFGELVLMNPIFQGKSEIDQIFKIFKVLGTPNDTLWPGFSKLPSVQRIKFTQYPVSNMRSRFNMLTVPGQALLEGLLTYNPVQRITAQDALDHSYFKESPLPIDPSMFPPWPVRSNSGSQNVIAVSVPSVIAEGSKPSAQKDDTATGFRINPSVMENRKLPTGGGFQLKF